MKKFISVLLVALMLVSLVACGQTAAPATDPVGGESGDAAPAGETIKIGYVSALSGDTALWGQAGLNGMLMTAEKVNADGGVLGRQVEVIGLDGKGDPADSVNAYKKLVDEYGVCAVVGTNFSSCNIPMAAVADELKVPVIGTAASNELVTVDENGVLHPYSFRLCFIDSYQGEVLGRYAADKGFKKGAIITDISDAYSTGVGAFIVESFTENGGEIVAQEEAQAGDQDFRAPLTKIAAADPDVLFIPWIYQNVALISKQARELGIDCVMLGADGWDSLELAEMAGEGTLEGCSFVSRIGFNTPEAAAYGEEYKAKYNIDLEAECLFGNDGLMWTIDAIKRANSDDPVAVRDALEATTTFKGLLGEMTMDPATHNPSRDIAVFTIKDGAIEFTEIYK